jgi:hypothetical protein
LPYNNSTTPRRFFFGPVFAITSHQHHEARHVDLLVFDGHRIDSAHAGLRRVMDRRVERFRAQSNCR